MNGREELQLLLCSVLFLLVVVKIEIKKKVYGWFDTMMSAPAIAASTDVYPGSSSHAFKSSSAGFRTVSKGLCVELSIA